MDGLHRCGQGSGTHQGGCTPSTRLGTVAIPGDCRARGGGTGTTESRSWGDGPSQGAVAAGHSRCQMATKPMPWQGGGENALPHSPGSCWCPRRPNPRKPEQRGVCEMQLVGPRLQGSEREREWIGEGVDPQRIDSVSQ